MTPTLAEVGVETWLAVVYCLGLLGLAYVIDIMARRAGAASEGGATFGFTYHESHDAWLCPEDQWLWPKSFDPDNRVMRYRAKPSICGGCQVKETCAPHGSGREVQRAVDPWPASEAARFHRGIACAVMLFGLTWPIGILVTRPGAASTMVLVGVMATSLLLSLPLWSHLRSSTVELPEGMAHVSLDDTVAERAIVAETIVRRRTQFGSDRRTNTGRPSW